MTFTSLAGSSGSAAKYDARYLVCEGALSLGNDRRLEVDEFLAKRPKTLPTIGLWTEVNRVTEQRMRLPILFDGEVSAFELELIVSPDSPVPDLRMILLYGRCIWRLCLDDAPHPNAINRPSDLPAIVNGPHHHSWPDNRQYARANQLPKHLKNARKLPSSVVTNDDAFAWFLDQIGVEYPSWGSPQWPVRTGLI